MSPSLSGLDFIFEKFYNIKIKMITHCVIRSGKNSGAFALQQYLSKDVESYYSENQQDNKVLEFASEKIFEIMNEKELVSDLDKISYFSSKKRVALDLTFSASKDISILSLVCGDDKIKNIQREVLGQIAKDINDRVHSRTKDITRQYKKSDALVQVYEHSTSRELDPQLHYHFVVGNKVVQENGTESASLCADKIIKDKYLINVRANYETMRKLQEEGYNAKLDLEGNVSLGLDEKIINAFSKRKEQIISKAKELGINLDHTTNREEIQKLVLATRQNKKNADIKSLRDFWRQELKELGISEKELLSNIKKGNNKIKITDEKLNIYDEIYDEVVKKLETQKGVFSESDLEIEFLKRLGDGKYKLVSLENLEKFLREKNANLIKYEANINKTNIKEVYFTTKNYLKIEKEIINVIKNFSLINFRISSIGEIQKSIFEYEQKKGFALELEQRQAVENILCGKQITIIQGHAGAGKTTAMEIVGNVARRKNIDVIALAPTGKAADELGKALGGKSQTIDSFLVRNNIKPNSIIVVDEAGMTSSIKMHHIVNIAKEKNCKLVLQGDVKQLRSVEAGDIFRDIQRQMQKELKDGCIVMLSKIRRQKTKEYLDLTQSMSEKEKGDYIEKLIRARDKYFKKYDAENINIISQFCESPKNTIIVTNTNQEKDILNLKIRKRLFSTEKQYAINIKKKLELKDIKVGAILSKSRNRKNDLIVESINDDTILLRDPNKPHDALISMNIDEAQKDLKENIYELQSLEISVGEKIIATRNSNRLGIKNGEIFEVININPDNMTIKNNNKEIQVNLESYNYFDYGYAMTTHKSQGMTVDNVIIASKDGKTNFQSAYVGITRGKNNCSIYTDDIVSFLYNSQFEQEKKTTLNIEQEQEQEQPPKSRNDIAVMLLSSGTPEEYRKYEKYIDDFNVKNNLKLNIKHSSYDKLLDLVPEKKGFMEKFKQSKNKQNINITITPTPEDQHQQEYLQEYFKSKGLGR